MHTFTIQQITDKPTVMFCRKCGLTFHLEINTYRSYWSYVPFTDASGDEFELSPMPTCTEIADRHVFEEFGKPE